MQTFNTYRDYFDNIQQNAASLLGALYELNTFRYGDSSRIIEAMKSDMTYPVLFAERPDYEYMDMGDNVVKYCHGAIVILSGFPKDDIDGQDNAIESAQLTAEKIIKQMRIDNYLHKGDKVNIEPLEGQHTDNTFGIRMTFTIRNMEGEFLCS